MSKNEEAGTVLTSKMDDIFSRLAGITSASRLAAVEAKISGADKLFLDFKSVYDDVIKFNSREKVPEDEVKCNVAAFDDLYDVIHTRYNELKANASTDSNSSNPTAQASFIGQSFALP